MVSNKTVSTNAFKAIYHHLETLARAYILEPTNFLAVRAEIDSAVEQIESSTDSQNLEKLKSVLNAAMDNNTSISFFKKLSETRMNGSLGVQNIAQFTARLGLIYYFELLSAGGDFSDLQAFRERAIDLKRQAEQMIQQIQMSDMTFESVNNVGACKTASKATLIEGQRKVIDRIDEMIFLLGQTTSNRATYQLNGFWHALVASYHLFGNVSQAYDITQLSFGVSGSKLNGVSYYQDK